MRNPMILLALLFVFSAYPASAATKASLQERMPEAEFRAAGLHKLSAEELARLDAWLAGDGAQAPTAGAAADPRGLEHRPVERTAITSRITGPFKGWRNPGEQVRLANGQTWEIVQFSGPLVVRLDNPEVYIEPASFGAWTLRVEGYNARAKVRRVQ